MNSPFIVPQTHTGANKSGRTGTQHLLRTIAPGNLTWYRCARRSVSGPHLEANAGAGSSLVGWPYSHNHSRCVISPERSTPRRPIVRRCPPLVRRQSLMKMLCPPVCPPVCPDGPGAWGRHGSFRGWFRRVDSSAGRRPGAVSSNAKLKKIPFPAFCPIKGVRLLERDVYIFPAFACGVANRLPRRHLVAIV